MKATKFEFRLRVAIICALYFLGFAAPWERVGAGASENPVRLWSWLAIETARTNLLSVSSAYLLVTILAVTLAIAGAALRISGTAYLGGFVMENATMQAGSLMASGPYRHLRNPLYVGMLLTAYAVAILMPVSGALFFIVAMTLFTLRLIGGEESFLTKQLGEEYLQYRQAVPSLLPSLRSRLAASQTKPRWAQSLLSEIYPLGTAICFAGLAWSYDANLLTRCILVCFGLHLLGRAVTYSRHPPAIAP